MRIINSKEIEFNYANRLFLDAINLIDIEARNYFAIEVMISTLKCLARFNMHRIKDNTINQNLVSWSCLRCNKDESLSYVVTCLAMHNFIEEWIVNLRIQLIKEDA